MDETFMPSVQPILAACKPEFRSSTQKKREQRTQNGKKRKERPPVQLVVVGATLKSAGYKLLRDTLPAMEMVSTKTLHKLPPTVTQRYERVFGADGRMALLLQTIRKDPVRRIIFCNSVASCQWVAKVLSEEGIPAAQLHGQLSVKERGNHFASFADGGCSTLVATDIASRGIDADVDQVIMFEFPVKRCTTNRPTALGLRALMGHSPPAPPHPTPSTTPSQSPLRLRRRAANVIRAC